MTDLEGQVKENIFSLRFCTMSRQGKHFQHCYIFTVHLKHGQCLQLYTKTGQFPIISICSEFTAWKCLKWNLFALRRLRLLSSVCSLEWGIKNYTQKLSSHLRGLWSSGPPSVFCYLCFLLLSFAGKFNFHSWLINSGTT